MIKKIVIVGGGIVGWLVVNYLGYVFLYSGIEIMLIELLNIVSIGVGEGIVFLMCNLL